MGAKQAVRIDPPLPRVGLRFRLSNVRTSQTRTYRCTPTSANSVEAVGSGLQSAYVEAVLPYPHGRTNVYKATLCLREKNLVRKRPECWTCSWCVSRSETMVSIALEASHCKVIQMNMGRNKQGNAKIGSRAA